MSQSNAKLPGHPEGVGTYIRRQSGSLPRYIWEQLMVSFFGWVPTVLGIGLRSLVYRLILRTDGWVAIENGVRLRFARNIRLGNRTYLDQGVYLHACPGGIAIGDRTLVMHGSILHVYNFRALPHAGIQIGKDSLIGEYNVIRGQGGVRLGDRVYTSPMVQMLAVDHIFDDPERPFIEQGITASGIVVEDNVWIGSGAILTDGIIVGCGSVIAAGAVVVDDVPPHTVVAGVPARVVRNINNQNGPSRNQPIYT